MEKELFKKIVNNYVSREGVDRLMAMLDRTDFYEAPASKNYHSNFPGGLVHHSLLNYSSLWDLIGVLAFNQGLTISLIIPKLKVGDVLTQEELEKVQTVLVKVLKSKVVTLESIVICGLFHDLHKLNYYEKVDKPVFKGYDESGKKIFEHEEQYKDREDQFVFGLDGTNSNYLIQSCMKLNYEEAIAIENHMGYISRMGLLPSASKAWTKSKLAALLHIADMMAAYVYESSGLFKEKS